MNFVTKNNLIHHVSLALSPIPSHPNSTTNFPTIAIIVVGMMATSLLLMAYYTFVIKCCLNSNNIDLIIARSFSFSRQHENQSSSISIASEPRGLDQEVISSIPIIHYKSEKENGEKNFSSECAFCLSEFEEDEKLRVIPNCNHLFHIDCVDIWLQNNANCPLCRSKVSLTREIQVDQHVLTPRPSPYFQSQNVENIIGGYEDFVVIDLDNNEHVDEGQNLHGIIEERGKELEVSRDSISPLHKKAIKLQKVTSMGDEGIIGFKDKFDGFLVQPIRRSFSMDLSIEVCGDSSRRVKRSFFPFGHGSISRSSVLPIQLEP
jgi:hypothetical protein